jgi:hypothetical protein
MKVARWLGALSGAWLIFNMLAMPWGWGGVSASEGPRAWLQLGILAGFLMVLVFDVLSGLVLLVRACWWKGGLGGERCEKGWLLLLALLAMVGLAGAKIMIDEIARETPLGSAGGEWVILYICLTLQLAYVLAFLFARFPFRGGTGRIP